MKDLRKNIIVKVGGSLLYKNSLKFNTYFLAKLIDWYKKTVLEYNKVVIVVGGGELSRYLGSEAEDLVEGEGDVHGIAMEATVLNAQIIKEILDTTDSEIYVPKTLGNALEAIWDDSTRVIVSGGLKKGWSTDMDAVVFADSLGLDRVYKLSNVDHIYTEDPKINPDSKPINDMSWIEYFELFDVVLGETEHKPNMHIPIDVLTAQFAYRKNLSFFVSGGDSLKKNLPLANIFESGTYIHP